ncbi:MAG TPA: hypothetical protein VMW24_22890 [Sedimentisphaerales bacterium]|nr:hypothetical protein [Sedimentisphaerales bacterium]
MDAETLSTVNEYSDALLEGARDVAVDAAGNIYVSNQSQIVKYDAHDKSWSVWKAVSAWSTAISPDGHLYTAYASGVHKYDLQDGSEVTWVPSGLVGAPYHIAVDSLGRVYITNFAETLFRFASDGTYEASWGGGDSFGSFDITGLAVSDGSAIYGVDGETRVFTIRNSFTYTGTFDGVDTELTITQINGQPAEEFAGFTAGANNDEIEAEVVYTEHDGRVVRFSLAFAEDEVTEGAFTATWTVNGGADGEDQLAWRSLVGNISGSIRGSYHPSVVRFRGMAEPDEYAGRIFEEHFDLQSYGGWWYCSKQQRISHMSLVLDKVHPETIYVLADPPQGITIGDLASKKLSAWLTKGRDLLEKNGLAALITSPVIPPDDDAVRVLLSKAEPTDDYCSEAQTADAQIEVTASIEGYNGELVFMLIDAPDLSPPHQHVNLCAGQLAPAPQYEAGGTYTGIPYPHCSVKTKEGGVATAMLSIASAGQVRSGDNYFVIIGVPQHQRGVTRVIPAVTSPLIVAWKRVYIEHDRMYRLGCDLAETAPATSQTIVVTNPSLFRDGDVTVILDSANQAGEERIVASQGVQGNTVTLTVPLQHGYVPGYDKGQGNRGAAVALVGRALTADAAAQQNKVHVTNASLFDRNDTVVVRIYDSAHPDGEEAVVSSVDGNEITLTENLANSYSLAQGAAVRLEADTYEADFTLLEEVFGKEAGGRDEGCFVQINATLIPGNKVPHKARLDDCFQQYSMMWRSRPAAQPPNYIHVIAAHTWNTQYNIYGYYNPMCNVSPVFCRAILQYALPHTDDDKAYKACLEDATAHEVAHHFGLAPGTFGHVDRDVNGKYSCFSKNPGYCLMFNFRERNGRNGFCSSCALAIRKAPDGLQD